MCVNESVNTVTYVCAITNEKVEVPMGNSGLPEGWMIPPNDISLDEWRDPLPKGTVLALSNEKAWKKLLKKRLNRE